MAVLAQFNRANKSSIVANELFFVYWIFAVIIILAYYNATVLSFMQQMYKYHRFEFKKHISSMLVLFITSEISLLLFFWMQVRGFYELFCIRAKVEDDFAMYDYKSKTDISFCTVAIMSPISWRKYDKPYGSIQLFVDLVVLLPVVTFLLFDNPHDCFTCLGKDPDRIYSSFQLSFQERFRRKMKAKYSSAQINVIEK